MKLGTTINSAASFPLWGKVGMGARTTLAGAALHAPTPTLPQRGRERRRLPFHALRVARSAMDD